MSCLVVRNSYCLFYIKMIAIIEKSAFIRMLHHIWKHEFFLQMKRVWSYPYPDHNWLVLLTFCCLQSPLGDINLLKKKAFFFSNSWLGQKLSFLASFFFIWKDIFRDRSWFISLKSDFFYKIKKNISSSYLKQTLFSDRNVHFKKYLFQKPVFLLFNRLSQRISIKNCVKKYNFFSSFFFIFS